MNKTVDLNLLLPLDDHIYEHCLRFPVDKNVTDLCFARNRNETEECKDGYVFGTEDFFVTAAIEWGLTCDRKWIKQLASAIFMSGMLFSSLICGYLSDKFGRRSGFYWAPGVSVIAGICAAYSQNIVMYTISSWFMSFTAYGMIILDFTIGSEIVPPNLRLLADCMYSSLPNTQGQRTAQHTRGSPWTQREQGSCQEQRIDSYSVGLLLS